MFGLIIEFFNYLRYNLQAKPLLENHNPLIIRSSLNELRKYDGELILD